MKTVIELSLKKNGTALLTPNFKVKEFACKDGTDEILIDTQLMWLLQYIRDIFEKPVIINSAYRTPAYNKKVGGATLSRHIQGQAADIVVKGVSPAEVYKTADKLVTMGGVGKYDTFTHVDVRGTKTRWEG